MRFRRSCVFFLGGLTPGLFRPEMQAGVDPVYGARPLNRLLNRELLNPLARCLIDGSVRDGDEVCIRG